MPTWIILSLVVAVLIVIGGLVEGVLIWGLGKFCDLEGRWSGRRRLKLLKIVLVVFTLSAMAAVLWLNRQELFARGSG